MSAPHDLCDPAAEPGAVGCLDEALGSLPAKYPDAVVPRHLSGLSAAQTAAALGCPRSTARSRAPRGLEKLCSALARPRGYALSPLAAAGIPRPAEAALPAGLAARIVAGCTGKAAVSPAAARAVEALDAMLF
jgi:hypothetical protein